MAIFEGKNEQFNDAVVGSSSLSVGGGLTVAGSSVFSAPVTFGSSIVGSAVHVGNVAFGSAIVGSTIFGATVVFGSGGAVFPTTTVVSCVDVDSLYVAGVKIPQYKEIPLRVEGATVRGSSGITDAIAWIADNSYQITGIRYAVLGIGSGSSSVNLGKAGVAGSTPVYSAARLLTADLNFMLSTLGSSPTGLMSSTPGVMLLGTNDIITTHFSGYFPAPSCWGGIIVTLKRI